MAITGQDVVSHFDARAARYDRSSAWCTDDELGKVVTGLARPGKDDAVLDVACGTGLVSRLFTGAVSRLVGLDVTAAMAEQARPYLDELVIAPAEFMPFPDATFDIVVCRQGIQFMDLPAAVQEMARVTRPGGVIVLVNLCAYGPSDRDEYFEILRLRNPVRRHFFLPDDLPRLLREAGCDRIDSQSHVSVEDVDIWSDNGAIGEDAREAIRNVYRTASPEFRALHAVREDDGRIVDNMLFVVAAGYRGAV